MADPIQVLREHIPDDYLGPDPNNQFSGERYGQHPEALAALAQVETLVEAAHSFEREYQRQRGAVNHEGDFRLLSDKQNALLHALAPFKDTT